MICTAQSILRVIKMKVLGEACSKYVVQVR